MQWIQSKDISDRQREVRVSSTRRKTGAEGLSSWTPKLAMPMPLTRERDSFLARQ
jgi:hypothetical protein